MKRWMLALLAAGSVVRVAAASEEEPAGEWLGLLAGQDHIVLSVAKSGSGEYSVVVKNLDQGAAAFPADKVDISSERMRLHFPTLQGTYEAQWNSAKATWEGSWIQYGMRRALELARSNSTAIAALIPRRPQEEAIERGALPYENEEVRFENGRAHITLAGTLSVPRGKGPFPAILLIAGAGPMTRDEGGSHKIFLVHADNLVRRGIAVLRYDKRGTGESTGDFASATFDDLISDARAAFEYLQRRAEADPHRLGILGHSEGGSIAPAVAAAEKHVSFLVLMAGSGLRGDQRQIEQQPIRAVENGASPEQAAKLRALWEELFAAARSTNDDSALNARIGEVLDRAAAERAISAQQAADIKRTTNAASLRAMINDDPLVYLRKVAATVPVLALIGSLDHTVPAKPYVAAMQPALHVNPRSTLKELPGHNHMFQHATTGAGQEMNQIEETASPLVLQTIGDWVAAQVK